jgi:molybdenum cofactor cytidylyltransferase
MKALLPATAPGETFLSQLAATLLAGGLDDLVLVLGHEGPGERDALAKALAALPMPVRPCVNPDPSRGQLSSLLTGLALVDRPGVSGMLVTPVDMPLVSAGTVRALLSAFRETGAPIVRPAWQGRHGHPVIFGRVLFDALRNADPAVGARAVVRAHASRAIDVAVTDDGAFMDVDTPEDYARAFGRPLPGGGVRRPT